VPCLSPGQSGYVIIGEVSDSAEYGRCPRGTRADVATKEWGAVMLPRQSRANGCDLRLHREAVPKDGVRQGRRCGYSVPVAAVSHHVAAIMSVTLHSWSY